MKDNEVHIISMVDEDGKYYPLGFTRSNSVSIGFIKRNFKEPYKTVARDAGVVGCFRVEAVYELSGEALRKKADHLIESMQAIKKLREKGM
jgi:hypothetical protein